MCGRYSVDLKWDDFARLYDLAMKGPPAWNFPPNFNQCPTDPIATVLLRDGKRAFQLMRWGADPALPQEADEGMACRDLQRALRGGRHQGELQDRLEAQPLPDVAHAGG
jgi:putative SOS response-associated peptidase YedK